MGRKVSSKRQKIDVYRCIIMLPAASRLEYLTALQGGKYKRSSITVASTASGASIEIRASDATALRASANSVLRDLQVIEASSKI